MEDEARRPEQPTSDEPDAEEPTKAELDIAEMTPQELAEAKEYGRLDLVCDLADRAIDLGYLAVASFLFGPAVDAWLAGFDLLGRVASLRLVALFAVVMGLHIAVSFPLSFYSGFRLEHRFKLSNETLGGWLRRYAKRNVLAIAFGMVMFLGLYWLIWLVGPAWWLVAAGAFFVVSIVFGQLAPVLILPLFYSIDPLEDDELSDRLSRLAEGTGLSIEGVYRLGMSEETSKANAMLAGLGRTRRVLLGDTVLEKFTPEEIEVIFGHEIGHHVYRHIHKIILAGVIYSAAGFWLCDRILMAAVEGDTVHANLPVATLPLLMFTITAFSMILEPLQNIVSRHFERQCDRYALERTGMPEAYLSAFRKLAKLNKDDPNPHPLEVFLFSSHPPIAERLAIAEK